MSISGRTGRGCRALPAEQRQKLVDDLERFDLLSRGSSSRPSATSIVASTSSIRQSRAEYLAVLRRYHNWLSRLPEDRRDEIMRTPASERLAAISKLASQPRYKVPSDRTPPFLQIAELGEYSPFELAANFKIWQGSRQPSARTSRDQSTMPVRLQVLFRQSGDAKKLPARNRRADSTNDRALAGVEHVL